MTIARKFAYSLAIVWLMTVGIAGTGAREETTEHPNIQSVTLKNGLEVITIVNHAVPLVTIELAARNGAFTEPPEFDGLSHLYEHMFFKANKAIPNQERYLERIRELGASFNGTTSNELVNYYITLPKSNLREGMEFMANAIRYPLFKEEEMIAERPVVTAEFDRAEATPEFHLHQETARRLWYKYFSRKNTIGDREVILTATREKMRTIQNRYYIPNNMALLIGGDIDPKMIQELAEEFYGDWEKGRNPFRAYPIPEHPALEESTTLAIVQPVGAISLQISYQGPSMRDDTEATFAADVFSFALGQPDSKFQRALVDSGHFDGIGLGYSSLVHTGPIYISGRTSADRFDAALAALDQEMARFLEPDYITDKEIETAKTQLEVSEIYSKEATSSFIHSLAFWWSTGGLDYYLNYLDNLRAVTRKDIEKYIKRYLVDQPRVTGFLCTEEDLNTIAAAKDAEIVRPKLSPAPPQESSESAPLAFEVDGLNVILKPNTANEIVALGLFLDGGTAFINKDQAGIELIALEAATKGSKAFPKEVVDRELAAMGTSISTDTDPDYSGFRMQCLKRNLDRSWAIFTDLFKNPLYDEREVELIRERHLNTIRQRKQDPDSSVMELARPNFYGDHPYAINHEGTEETIAPLRAEDLRTYQQKNFVRARMTLVAAGDLTQDELTALVKSGLADLPLGSYEPQEVPPPEGIDKAKQVTEERELPTTYVVGLHHAPSTDNPDYPAMVVAENILYDRVFEEVRTKRSLSYAPAAGIARRRANFGYLYVTSTQPNEAMEVMLGEVRRLIEEPVSEKDLRDHKNDIVTRYLIGNQQNGSQVSRLAAAELTGGGYETADHYLDAIEAVRPADISRVAEKYINTISFSLLGNINDIDANVFSGSIEP